MPWSDDIDGIFYRTEVNRLKAVIDDLKLETARLEESLEESEHREATLRNQLDQVARRETTIGAMVPQIMLKKAIDERDEARTQEQIAFGCNDAYKRRIGRALAELHDVATALHTYQNALDKIASEDTRNGVVPKSVFDAAVAQLDEAQAINKLHEERLAKPIQAWQLEELVLWDRIKNESNAKDRALSELQDVASELQRRSELLADCLSCDEKGTQ